MSPTDEPRILVVDDDPHVRDALARLFRRNGYQVATAVSGLRALERLRRESADGADGLPPADEPEAEAPSGEKATPPPAPDATGTPREESLPFDCMFVDLLMPDMDGRRFIEALRAEDLFPLERVIVLTAVQHADNATAYMQYGCAGYCGKPWDNDRILAQVRRVIEGGGPDRLDALV